MAGHNGLNEWKAHQSHCRQDEAYRIGLFLPNASNYPAEEELIVEDAKTHKKMKNHAGLKSVHVQAVGLVTREKGMAMSAIPLKKLVAA